VGASCDTPAALAAEGHARDPSEPFQDLHSTSVRIRLRIPARVFSVKESAVGLDLVSALAARGLGPDATMRPFAIRVRRLARGLDEVLADKGRRGVLAHAFLDEAFPDRTAQGFVTRLHDPMAAGCSVRTTVAGRPAFVVINGVEGYDTDVVLVGVGPQDTLVVFGDWNSAIMGKPECYQRVVLGDVVDSIVLDAP
jgi:hypothetical protein